MPPIQTLSLEALPESDREAPESDQDTTLGNEKDALGEILEAAVRTVRPFFTALTSLEKKRNNNTQNSCIYWHFVLLY